MTLCILILGIASTTVGWHLKKMVATHYFHNQIDHLVVDLRKYQIVALANRVDIDISIKKRERGFSYIVKSEDALDVIPKLAYQMKQLEKMKIEKKSRPTLNLHISPTGRITPTKKIHFFHKGERFTLDLTAPLQIKLLSKHEFALSKRSVN